MNEVTDPKILEQLNAPSASQAHAATPQGMKEVTDPAVLAQLNHNPTTAPVAAPQASGQSTGQTNPDQQAEQAFAGGPTAGQPLLALGGGAGQTIGHAAEMLSGFGTDAAVHAGVMSPQTKQNIDSTVNGWLERQKGLPEVQQAMQDNPKTAIAGNILGGSVAGGLGGAVGAAAALPAATAIASGVGAAPLAASTAASYAGNALVGSIAAGDNNRLLGAGLGAVVQKAVGVLGSVAKNVLSSAMVKDTLNNVVSKVNSLISPNASAKEQVVQSLVNNYTVKKAAVDAAEDAFTSIKGNYVPSNTVQSLKEMIKTPGLSDTQQKFIQGKLALLQPEVPGATATSKLSIKQLVDLKRNLNDSKTYNTFNPNAEFGDVSNAYQKVLDGAQKDIANALKAGGNDKAYSNYSTLYNQTLKPLQSAGIQKLHSASELYNKGEDITKFDQLSDQFYNKLTAKDAGQRVADLGTALDPNGKAALQAAHIQHAFDATKNLAGEVDTPIKFNKYLNDLKSTYGSTFDPDVKSMLEGAQKIVLQANKVTSLGEVKGVDPSVIHYTKAIIGNLMDSSGGKAVLKAIGNHQGVPASVGELLKSGVTGLTGQNVQQALK